MTKNGYKVVNDNIDLNVSIYHSEDATSYDRELALYEVIEACYKLVISTISSENKNSNFIKENMDDIAMDAKEFVINHINSYIPAADKHFTGYLVSRAKLSFFQDIRKKYSSAGNIDKNWIKVKASILAIRDSFHQINGFYPTTEALKKLVEESFLQRYIVGEATPKNIAAALQKMKKDGISRALSEFSAILLTIGEEVKLDALVHESDAFYAKDLLCDLDISDLSQTPIEAIYALALGDNLELLPAFISYFGALGSVEGSAVIGANPEDTVTLSKIAGHYDLEKSEIKKTLLKSKSRITAPHAQYCYLPPIFAIKEPANTITLGY